MKANYAEANVGKGIAGLLLAPVVGLLYVVSMPFVAVGTLVALVVKKAAAPLADMVSFGWRPLEANLSGKKQKREKKD